MYPNASTAGRTAEQTAIPLAPIPAALGSLDGSLSYLNDRLNALRDRLEPVLRPAEPKDPTKGSSTDSRYLVSVADQVSDHATHARALGDAVADIIDRVAV